MCLIHFDTEVVLDPLHGQVLAKGAKLVIYVEVVGRFRLPLALQKLKSLLENGFRPYFRGVGRAGQTKVILFDRRAGALDRQVLCAFV